MLTQIFVNDDHNSFVDMVIQGEVHVDECHGCWCCGYQIDGFVEYAVD